MAAAGPARPAISVVTATYNRPRWLSCAIRSVLGQTFADWEMIVVGDACTDDTAQIVAGFGDSRIRFVNLSRNFGEQAGPNNYGMAEAGAPLIALLNHDDVWLPNHLQLCREVMLGQSADFTFGTAAYIDAQSNLADGFSGLSVSVKGTGRNGGWSPAVVEDVVPASSWLMRREVLYRLGGWRLGRECHTDPSQDYLFRVWKAGFAMRAVKEVTVVMVSSARRPGSYQADHASEQEWVLEHMGRPGFACELAARAYDSNAHFEARHRRRLTPVLRTGGRLLAWLGVSPRSLYFRLHHRFAAGDYIRALRARRSLPAFQAPAGELAGIRFEMVRRSCAVTLPCEVEFSAGRGGARFLAHGWSWPEPTGVWTDGPGAALLFDVGHPPSRDLLVELEIMPFMGPDDRPRTVHVDAGGRRNTWTLDGRATKLVRIPAGSIKHPAVLVEFWFPSTASPKAAGLSGDSRDLAIHLLSARVALDPQERSGDG